jgi:hypothetical protein
MQRMIATPVALFGAVAIAAGMSLAAVPAGADNRPTLISVPTANPRFGVQNTVLTPSARQTSVAWGSLKLTNPDAANGVTHYGYNTANGGPLTQAANEANKTEPDKNVYLVLGGKHYLYQGHELGPRGYVTRINLDETDPAKRVTLISDVASDGTAFPTIDGITWNPFSKQLLLTSEAKAPTGGVFAISLDDSGNPVDGKAVRLSALGSGGYEGVQNDSDGNVWIVEDVGGAAASGGKVPNSYLYRFVPTDKADLTMGGSLQALQVKRGNGQPATAAELQANPSDGFISDLHTYGTSFSTTWVEISHGTTSVNATAAAAAAKATPFKRPENGVFRPGTSFREFYFTETGDTNATSTLPGAFGGVFKLSQSAPSAMSGSLSPAYLGDVNHTGLDNITFASSSTFLAVEDAGDLLHGQRNALDSGYAVTLSEGKGKEPSVVRFMAEGRDASAAFDAAGGPSYNDGDNEITGIHVSDGDPSAAGVLGAKVPRLSSASWRTFWTQQHGDNITWEITWTGRLDDEDR